MASALQTAVLGMRAYQEMLSVAGNNIANADTTAFKEDRVTFAEMFAQTFSKGSRATAAVGGTNPVQVGLGVRLSSVDQNLSQGNFSATESDFDLAMDGAGYFVVNDGTSYLYTRDGSFDVDAAGYLVDPSTGYRLQRMGTAGEVEGFQVAGNDDIFIPYDTVLPGQYTQTINFVGNLSANEYTPTTSALQAMDMAWTKIGGGTAEATDLFTAVTELQGFGAGDDIQITGRQNDGTAVASVYNYLAGDTIQDLLDDIVTAFGGATEVTASMTEGKVTLTSANSGYSLLDLNLSSIAQPASMPTDFDYTAVGGAEAQTTNIDVFDRQGVSHSLTGTFVRHDRNVNTWDLVINSCADSLDIPDRRIAGLSFDENGTFQGVTETDGFGNDSSMPGFAEWDSDVAMQFPGIVSVQQISGDFGTIGFYDGLTQFGGSSSAGAINQDGYESGSLQSVSVNKEGLIQGTFSNGVTLEIANLRLAMFGNEQGLERVGANYYESTPAAGSLLFTQGLQGRAGGVRQSVLEDSNVDVAKQFTNLIVAQRGFQVNSRTVRVANTMLQQLTSIIV